MGQIKTEKLCENKKKIFEDPLDNLYIYEKDFSVASVNTTEEETKQKRMLRVFPWRVFGVRRRYTLKVS